MKKLVTFVPAILLASCLAIQEAPLVVAAESEKQVVDYSTEKWDDVSPKSLWSVNTNFEMFEYNVNNVTENDFVSNLYVTNQFDTKKSVVELSATFKGSLTSSEVVSQNREVHIGLVPWYIDANNWIIVYAKFAPQKEDPETKKMVDYGHIFDVQVYCRIGGSTLVNYYVRNDTNKWISPIDSDAIEWHSTWPDGVNADLNPPTLEGTEPDPSEENTIYVRKTRRTYAGRKCDSFYLTVNGYELNFGRDDIMFSDPVNVEEANESIMPKVGFYVMSAGYTTVTNFEFATSEQEILPVPTIEPLSNLTTSGTVGSKVKVPEFVASDSYGEIINNELFIYDPNETRIYLDKDESNDRYFIPTNIGYYNIVVKAVDSQGYEGEFEYKIKIKESTGHIDHDYYNDFLTVTPVDNTIKIAWGIFISTPIVIALYIAAKIVIAQIKKRKLKNEKKK